MAGSNPEREVLGTFSINEDGKCRNDFSQRRFLVEPDHDRLSTVDLRGGIDGYISQKQGNVNATSLSPMLEWIHDNKEGLIGRNILETERGETRKLEVDFVGTAKIFSHLLRACESIDRLEILVTLCNGTYYIESTHTKTPPRREVAQHPAPVFTPHHVQPPSFVLNANVQPFYPRLHIGGQRPIARLGPPRSARASNRTRTSGQYRHSRRTSTAMMPERNDGREIDYAGRKFAQSVTSTDGMMPNVDQHVNAKAKYVAVIKTQHGQHKIILSSEVQAERKDSDQQPPGNYVAIRTRKAHLDGKPFNNFKRYKTLQWWSRTYIAGIPEVMCGMRDDNRHLITSAKMIKVDKLPGMSDGFWDPKICRKKFRDYLSDIKNLIQDDDHRAVYRLELPDVRPGPGIKDRLQNRKFTLHGRKDDGYLILTDHYLQDVLNIQHVPKMNE